MPNISMLCWKTFEAEAVRGRLQDLIWCARGTTSAPFFVLFFFLFLVGGDMEVVGQFKVLLDRFKVLVGRFKVLLDRFKALAGRFKVL